MSEFLDRLKNWGCDVDGAMERMLNDEEFYMECLQQTADDAEFEKLGEVLARRDVQASFDAAHTLKGVLANMGLTPLYDSGCGSWSRCAPAALTARRTGTPICWKSAEN